MRFFKDQFAFTINTSHHGRLVKTWERLNFVLDFMGADEYTTIVPLVEGVEEDLKAVVEDIEEIAEGQGERRDTEHPLITKVRDIIKTGDKLHVEALDKLLGGYGFCPDEHPREGSD